MKKIVFFVIATLTLFIVVKTVPGIVLVGKLIFNGGATLASSSGRTNILILGIGGKNHEGGDLTDTMMVLSLNANNKSMAMISIPRDIWSDTLKDKVNSAYHYGGLLLAKVVVEDVLGVPVHYGMVVDFSGFQRVIDEVGGIDVTVPTAFTDTEYPCENDTCIYKTVSFEAGFQHMDGARALIYARSRHAEGDEGSDFARSRRQQFIIVALKNKIMRPFTWFSISRVKNLSKVFDEATETDMNMGQMLTIGKLVVGVKEDNIKKISLDDKLETPPSYLYGRYVLVPVNDWETIHSFITTQVQQGE